MRNKIREISYFICLMVLFWINLPCSALNSSDNIKISGQLTQNRYQLTSEIEKLFKQNLNLGECIIYTRVPRGLIVSICSTLFFEEGHDVILESSKPLLSKIAQLLKFLDKSCIIESNTAYNSVDKSDYTTNWELSTVRADEIADYLIKVEKINPQKIQAIGFGELMPFSSNVSYKNNMDKRIDFVIINYEKENPLN